MFNRGVRLSHRLFKKTLSSQRFNFSTTHSETSYLMQVNTQLESKLSHARSLLKTISNGIDDPAIWMSVNEHVAEYEKNKFHERSVLMAKLNLDINELKTKIEKCMFTVDRNILKTKLVELEKTLQNFKDLEGKTVETPVTKVSESSNKFRP
jgi:hypothetical protein